MTSTRPAHTLCRVAACFLFLMGCSRPSTPASATDGEPGAPTPFLPAATPTLLGTVARPVPASPAPTPRPAACRFRPSIEAEIGVYPFDWDNATLTLDTRLGPVIVDGPRTLTPGPRRLILSHHVNASAALAVAINFDVGGSLLYDLASSAQEVRDEGGTVLIQTLADAVGDTGGLPPYLDIVRIERTFGYYPNSLLRLYLGGVRSGPPIWTTQNIAVSLEGETYNYQSRFDDQTALTVTDRQGRTKDWPGQVTVEQNLVTFALETGWKEAVSASTSTSGGPADTAGPFPVETMQGVWEKTLQACP